METRTAFRGSVKSRQVVALAAAVLAAFMLAAIGVTLVKVMSTSIAVPSAHIVAGQPDASTFGSAWNYSTRRSGIQTVEGPVAPSTTAKFRAPSVGRGGPQS
jgi:hypothetical protein